MNVNPANVIQLLSEEYGPTHHSPPNAREQELARQISELLRSHLHSNVEFEADCELVFENQIFAEDIAAEVAEELADEFVEEHEPGAIPESDELESEEQAQCSGSCYGTPATPVNRKPRNDITYKQRKKAVAYWRSSLGKRRRTSSVSNRFRFVKSDKQLETWEEQIKRNGPLHEKLMTIAQNVRNRFIEARSAKKSIHDADLRRWALVEARGVNLDNFKASRHWIRMFKNANRIVSRKITKFVSHGASEKDENVILSSINFVNSIVPKIKKFKPENVYNTDQSGFSLEMHGGRTLENVGTRRVEAHAQSVSATTHSYTIMPTLSASGNLLSPLVIVFKEPGGKFGPVVEQTMFKPPNVLAIAAKSSIMGKLEIKRWYEEAFLPNCGASSLLLVDSLKAYGCVKESKPKEKSVEVETIPPHTTGLIQPFDVFLFRPWKTFARKISEFVLLENEEIFLRQRDNISKLQSLIHNQLSAPLFHTFRLACWYKAGYLKGEQPSFVHPINFCFSTNELYCSKCAKLRLIKCAYCNQCLCIQHAIVDLHHHKVPGEKEKQN